MDGRVRDFIAECALWQLERGTDVVILKNGQPPLRTIEVAHPVIAFG